MSPMMNDLIRVDPALLARWNRAVPRYTSYPTAPQFKPMEGGKMAQKLELFSSSSKPLSLYVHIPFCKTMCLFCACSVILNRNPERQATYLTHLLREIEQTAQFFSQKRPISQLHLGGGTPTSLTEEELAKLMAQIHRFFSLSPTAEISIEIDPRTVYADGGKKLSFLKQLGFNRVSFGVQDCDSLVQEAIRRRQTEEMTQITYEKARELGFAGINIDLIYGLPHQTVDRFAKTAEKLLELKPDRIAFYSYAKLPWLKQHQKAIPEETLPSTEEKFNIYVETRARWMEGGYTAIGMDHFALPSDSMAEAYRSKKLTRNFQGYSVQLAEDLLGFGVTSISFLENSYFQNIKDLTAYQTAVAQGKIPIERGYLLTEEDQIRRQAILSLMCHFAIEKQWAPLANLTPLIAEGFLEETPDQYIATPIGRLFIRLIASAFDAYLTQGHFSKAV